MAITTSRVTITSSATLIFEAGVGAKNVLLRKIGNAAVLFIGASDVTVSTGMPLPPDTYLPFKLQSNEAVYGITDGENEDVSVMSGLEVA